MDFRFDCPHCSASLKAREEWRGRKATCKSCGAKVVVPPLDSAIPADAITGSIEPVTTTLGYRLAIAPVAFLMVLLPLIYLAIVAGVGIFTVGFAVNGTSIFGTDGRTRGHILLYLGPLLGSALTFVFLLKPLFSKLAISQSEVELSPEEQPILFDFVQRIAKAVHAPVPTRISLDTQVNASASFRRGWLSMLRSGDLELRIGLPLVERLSAGELAGVIAHELGHFSQGLGMRLSYVVRSISFWFARVVYQRDKADEWLTSAAGSGNLYLWILLRFAMGMIWLSRRILWILMMVGHAFSGLLMRQMEFDADLHEIRLAGSDRFISTAKKLPRLANAYQEAIAYLEHSFVDGRLADNLPALVGHCFDQQSAEQQELIEENSQHETASCFDTHPLDRDRIAQATKTSNAGILRLQRDSQSLFSNYDTVAKTVTEKFYSEVFEQHYNESMLTSMERISAMAEIERDAARARENILGKDWSSIRSFPIASPENRWIPESESAGQLRQLKKEMDSSVTDYGKIHGELTKAEDRWFSATHALSMHSAGVKFNQAQWNEIPVESPSTTQAALEKLQAELGALHEEASEFEIKFAARVDAAVQYLWACQDTETFSASIQRERGIRSVNALLGLMSCQHLGISIRKALNVLLTFSAEAKSGKLTKAQQQVVDQHLGLLWEVATQMHEKLTNVSYPFDHSRGEIDLAQFIAPNGLKLQEFEDISNTGMEMLQNYSMAYFRTLGVVCSVIQNVDRHLADFPESASNSSDVLGEAPETNPAPQPAANPSTSTDR